VDAKKKKNIWRGITGKTCRDLKLFEKNQGPDAKGVVITP